jgi:hypothetical protein
MEREQQLYLMLGEIKATQSLILNKLDEQNIERKELAERVSRLETRINRAAGALAVLLVFIQAGWNYITGKA